MAKDKEKTGTGPNESPVNETIACTGPGIPDEALGPDEELPEPPSDTQVEQARRDLGGEKEPESKGFSEDPLPVEGQ